MNKKATLKELSEQPIDFLQMGVMVDYLDDNNNWKIAKVGAMGDDSCML